MSAGARRRFHEIEPQLGVMELLKPAQLSRKVLAPSDSTVSRGSPTKCFTGEIWQPLDQHAAVTLSLNAKRSSDSLSLVCRVLSVTDHRPVICRCWRRRGGQCRTRC